ncbi:MAG: hypothetical protein CM15mP58_23080 [Burkholderiaceae bacterium]|nr:MAG: hypothetical protein CM15mP58_23080 [Burkholderiaceae bacterium]
MATEKAVEIIDIYTHKVEKRLDRLGTYLVFIAIPLLLIIAMQQGALIIYLFFLARLRMGHMGFSSSMFLSMQ